MIRVGLIGAGTLVQVYHLPNLVSTENVEVVAICDTQIRKAGMLARRYDIDLVFKDPLEMFKRAELDAVLICTPTHLHMPYTIQALRNGLHVFIEQPAAMNAKETAKILKEKTNYPKQCVHVSMNARRRDDAVLLRDAIRAKELGKLFYIKAGWLQPHGSGPTSGWRLDPALAGGGVLMDQGVAIVDTLLYMLGFPDVKSVHGACFNHLMKKRVEDTVSAHLALEGGALIHMDASWCLLPDKSMVYGYFHGDKGSASSDPLRISRDVAGKRYSMTPFNLPKGAELYQKSYAKELELFLKSITAKDASSQSLDEAHKTMRVVDAIYRSAKMGRPVKL
jgi:predicted dehydrogenase